MYGVLPLWPIYLLRKIVCFVCHIEISQIGPLQIALLVSFENSQ
jgi:hypothetical protein